MAGNIKGITIEFRGDTTSLDKALRKVKSDAKGVDSQLRQVNNALKFNPKNVELLTQKQTLLRQKVKQTEDSLKELKNVQAQMDAKGVDKNSEEYQKLRREIITTESKLKHFKAESEKLNNIKLTVLGKEIEDVGKKMKTTGDAMSKYITAPIAAMGAASGKAWGDVQDGLNKVTALTGASGAALEEMHGIVRDIAKTVPADMETIGNAVGEVNTRFGLTGEELEEVSAQFVKFADINGTDVISSIDGVQKAMSAYGLDASHTGEVLDIMTKAAQNTGVSVDRLYSGLVSNSTAFQEMGLDINQSATLMGQLEKSGANAETVLNGMRRALKYAAAEGKPLDEVLVELQDSIQNSTDETEGLSKAYEVFGRNGDQMYGVIKSGALDFAALGEASTDAEGALDSTFKNTMTPAKKFQTTLNSLKILGYDVANRVMPYVEKGIKAVQDVIEKLGEKWNKLGPKAQKTILAIVGALALVGPALSIVGRLLTGVGKAIQNVTKVMGALSKAMSFLAANPIALIIAGIVAIVAAFVILWKKSEAFRNFWTKLWENIKKVAQTVWQSIQAVFTTAWNAIKAVWNTARAFFVGVWNGIKAVFAGVVTFYRTIFTTALNAVKAVWNGIKAFFSGIWNGIKAIFSGVASWFGNIFTGAREKIKTAFNSVTGFFSGVWNGVKGVFSGVASWFGGVFANAWSAIKQKFAGWASFWGGLWESVKSKFTGIGSSIASAFTGAITSGINGIIGTIESVINKGIGLINGAIDIINKIPRVNIGKIETLNLPRLASGGIVDEATIAMIGEGKSAEAVIPLDELWKRMDKMTANIGGSGDAITINVYGAEGQSVQAIAEAVERKLIAAQNRRRKAWA